MNSFFIGALGETIGPVASLAATIIVIAIALWIAWLILKRFRNGLFVSNGTKGRLPRLAVTDAVPVDSHRRIILVRRDDVEHLIMIGGPTDIVVETGISRSVANPAQPATLPQAPRLPVQNTQPPATTGVMQQSRTPILAARDAVSEAERGRPVRSPENLAIDRRQEPAITAGQPTVPTSAIAQQPAPAPFANTIDRAAQLAAQQVPTQAAVSQQSPARNTRDLDMDSLISDLKFNPGQDR